MTLSMVGLIRAGLTVVLCTAFIALWIWAWSKHRKAEFDAAAQLPLQDDIHDTHARPASDC
jgi:cytochrome c oxidase cbb3-type subunit 4